MNPKDFTWREAKIYLEGKRDGYQKAIQLLRTCINEEDKSFLFENHFHHVSADWLVAQNSGIQAEDVK